MASSRRVYPFISVVIAEPTDYQGSRGFTIHDTLDSLRSQSYPARRVELIVSAAGWDRDTLLRMKNKYRGVKLLHSPRDGYFYLKNLGMKKAKGEIIALADADCVYGDHWLSSIAETIGRGNEISVGLSVIDGRSIPRRLASFYTLHSMLIRYRNRIWRFNSHNVAFRREVILDTLYDEHFERFGGCLQLAWRLNRSGFHMGFHPRQEATHNFYGFKAHSWQAALVNGCEIIELRRLDPKVPLAGLLRLSILAPPIFSTIFFASDVYNLAQNRALMGILWYELPIFLFFSLATRFLETVGMYWMLFSPNPMRTFVNRLHTR